MSTQHLPQAEAQVSTPTTDNNVIPELEVERIPTESGRDKFICTLLASKLCGGDAKPLPVPPLYTVRPPSPHCDINPTGSRSSSKQLILVKSRLQMALSFIGAFGALLAVAGINIALAGRISLPLLLAPFGASATLLFVKSGLLTALLQKCRGIPAWHIGDASALTALTVVHSCRPWGLSRLPNLAMSSVECCYHARQGCSLAHSSA